MKKTFKRTIQRMIASTLTAVMLFGVVTSNQLIAYGYTAKTGMIYSSGKSLVETKVSASPNAAKANGLEYGKPVTVINETTGTDGLIWYQVTYKLKAGGSNTAYVPRANVLLDSDVTVFANGHINANEVAFRDDAGTDRTTILASLYVGHTLELLDSTTVSGSLWYRVRTTINGTSSIGWVYGAYVTVDEENIETEEEYEAYLRGLGFPESYVHKLAVLHAKYPNWVFQPYSTGLNWNTVITQESYPGRNLVYKTEDDAKKSMDYRAYTWSTNTWTVYDSSGWVSAHPDFIAYCMDPRNFLNETNIWMFESLSYSASHTTSGVAAIIKGTFMEKATYLDYKSVFMQVAKTTGVSAYHIASRIRQEQGVNGSKMISGTYPGYEGYYNYFNIGAAGVGEKVYTSGLSRAKKEGWNTRLKAIQGGAAFIGSKYIGVGQDTLYTQKFDVVSEGGLYTHQYMTNVQAAISESKTIAKAVDKTQAFVFKIPVYNNMPDSPVSFTASGNRNNYLKSLSVSGLSLTPTFNGATTSYSLIVDNAVSSITVSATPVVSKSTLAGTGTYNLKVGTNTIKVYCRSQSGDIRTYTLTVVRQGQVQVDYTLESSEYTIGTYITNVQEGTTASDFIGKITCTGGTMKLLTAAGAENTGTVATGNKLAIYVNNVLVATKEIVIYGDVNGDGNISMGDLVKVNRHILGVAKLNGVYFAAGDVNHKGDGITMSDLVITNRHLLQLTTITQQ